MGARVFGWPLVFAAGFASAAVGSGAFVAGGGDKAGLHLYLRVTARCAVTLFALAFAARPSVQVTRGAAWAKALLANRRYLGVSFGAAMAVHGIGVLLLAARVGPGRLARELMVGGAAYLLIGAMVVTSTDRSAAWLGRRGWKVLHTAGMWIFGAFFLLTYTVGAAKGRLTVLPWTILIVSAWSLRLAAMLGMGRQSLPIGRER